MDANTPCRVSLSPLLDSLSNTIALHNRDVPSANPEDLVVQINGPPIRLLDKQWDDSKTLAIKSMGNVFFEYLPKIVKTARYEETWAAFVAHLKRSFIEDRPVAATAAMQSFEKVLTVSLDGAEASRITSSWEVAWAAWDEIGHSVVALSHPPSRATTKTLTQVNLEAYVRVVLPIYTPPYLTFDLSRIHRLLAILKAVLTFARSPDYRCVPFVPVECFLRLDAPYLTPPPPLHRPDIDTLTPLQAAILEVVAAIKLEVPGAASAVLADLSEYLTLTFIAAFDSEVETSIKSKPRATQRVSYVALAKEVMPHVLWLYQRYKDDISIYEQGAVERMFAVRYFPPFFLRSSMVADERAFAILGVLAATEAQARLSAPVQVRQRRAFVEDGDGQLPQGGQGVRCGARGPRSRSVALSRFHERGPDHFSVAELPSATLEGIWRQLVDGYRGALLTDSYVPLSLSSPTCRSDVHLFAKKSSRKQHVHRGASRGGEL